MWGGIECTVNRVENTYFDQISRTGHDLRPADLDLFADLGLKTLRYPVLWERTAPGNLADADWSWPDERLSRIRELHIAPIVGLVHHGSGPRHTSLLDHDFPEKLAAYAGVVARRYPWVEMYTPINEPLTTARFSCLYGHWYPHRQGATPFFRALVNQCRGIVLSMQAIRLVNPQAQLVQTEDLGKTYSTPRLAYQANFENERRWLSLDLLCGRVGVEHPLWRDLAQAGINPEELEWFRDNAMPPDILGLNYYLTSERFVDHNLDAYPPHLYGGNGRDRYVDVEAVRALPSGIAGAGALVCEAWDRYGLPVAITEAHNGCTREQQMLWLAELWSNAIRLRASGVDVRAVTPWALLGAYDWQNLVTRADGHYESGVFDVRSTVPRPTALAGLVREMVAGIEPSHPAMQAESWWHRPSRMTYMASRGLHVPLAHKRVKPRGKMSRDAQPLLVTGGTGTLGTALARICGERGLPFRSTLRHELDITDRQQVAQILESLKPWAVVNAAGYVRVDDAEREQDTCLRENTLGPTILATECAARGISLVTFSSDLVFDGNKGAPYVESDAVSPLNVYGRSKAAAETAVLAAHPGALVVRTSAFFGPWDRYNFVTLALDKLARGERVTATEQEIVSPTYVPDLINAVLDLLIDGEKGIWHLANVGAVSWANFARLAAESAGLDPSLVESDTHPPTNPAKRPQYTALLSERGSLLPSLQDALEHYMQECSRRWRDHVPATDAANRGILTAS